jgi:S1-C subfamily serine protease
LIAQGHVAYPYLGVDVVTNTPALAAQYGLPSTAGVAVVQLPSGSPAAAAGVQSKDVITAIDGHAVTDTSSLSELLASYKPGDKITLTWVQATSKQTVSKAVTLGTAPST